MEYVYERAFYRLAYPLFLRPALVIGPDRYVVIDVSEGGLRYHDPGPPPDLGRRTTGLLYLLGTPPLEIIGTVVRLDPPHIALALTKGLPFGLMLDQQRLLQQRLVAWR